LEINVGKAKIIRFRKTRYRDRLKKMTWRGKRIEEVKEFNYLRFVVSRNGGQEAHIRTKLKRQKV